jgi:hypothetical protein
MFTPRKMTTRPAGSVKNFPEARSRGFPKVGAGGNWPDASTRVGRTMIVGADGAASPVGDAGHCAQVAVGMMDAMTIHHHDRRFIA